MREFMYCCIGTQNQAMLQSSPKRIKRQHDHHHLIDSKLTADLPDDVLAIIFSFLPIKEAVRVGILSPRFRNSWTLSRKLCFDQDFARGRSQADFIVIVRKIFNLHAAPTIQSFQLYFDPIGVGDIVQEWIKQSIGKGVEELDLDFRQGRKPFHLSLAFLNNESPRILKLCNCTALLPQKFQGLGLLNTLVLKKVHLTSLFIETVLRNCLLLESMDITQCNVMPHLKIYAQNLNKFKVLKVGGCGYGISRIDIDAPNLRLLHYSGRPVIFRFVHVLMLNDVILHFLSSGYIRRENPIHVYDLFNAVVFSTTATFVETLFSKTVENKFEKPPVCFWHLKEFQLFMEGASFCNVYDIACFLKNCPRLEKIFIDLNEFSFACGYYWESYHKELLDKHELVEPFNSVKFIKLSGFKFQKHELELVKYLLQKTIFLENLVLVTPKNSREKDYATDIQRYDRVFCKWKASKTADINVFDYFDDRSSVHPQHLKVTWF